MSPNPLQAKLGFPSERKAARVGWLVVGTHFFPETPVAVLQVVWVHLLGEGRKRTEPMHIWGCGPPLGVQRAFELVRWPCLFPGTT